MNEHHKAEFEKLLAVYKEKSYQELLTLADETDITHESASENAEIKVLKNVYDDGLLEINLQYNIFFSIEEYEKQQNEQLKRCVEILPPEDYQAMEKQLKKVKPVFSPNNPNLVFHYGWQNYFEKKPSGELIEDDFTLSQKMEEELVEEADWFGKTGLDEETERSLPRYLRLELGELLVDEECLRAADLTYLGCFELTGKEKNEGEFSDGLVKIYIWAFPEDNEPYYAYVAVFEDGQTSLSMGEYCPKR